MRTTPTDLLLINLMHEIEKNQYSPRNGFGKFTAAWTIDAHFSLDRQKTRQPFNI